MTTDLEAAIKYFGCPYCKAIKGASCTQNGKPVALHPRRWGRGEGWVSRQTEIDALNQQISDLKNPPVVTPPAPTPVPQTITSGTQINALNTGIAYAGLVEANLTKTNGNLNIGDNQIVSNKVINGTVFMTGSNSILRNCIIRTSGINEYGINISGKNNLVENCLIQPTSPSTSMYNCIGLFGDSNTVQRCDMSGGENLLQSTGTNAKFIYNYGHDASVRSNSSGHADGVEMFAGSILFQYNRWEMGGLKGDGAFNLSPYSTSQVATSVKIWDNFIDGGQSHFLIDNQTTNANAIQNLSILRNVLGGHTNPDTNGSFGIYHALYNRKTLPIVETAAAQASNPNSIYWPSSGPDVNLWGECNKIVLGINADGSRVTTDTGILIPNNSGTIAKPVYVAPTLMPAQPFTVVYNGSVPASAIQKGSLVLAGRENYNNASMKAVSAAGGTVLVYIDTIINNPYGRYHDLLYNASQFGPAVPTWPGLPTASQWGSVADFRVGGVLQSKLEGILELIVSENPHIAGFFADDIGTRSWFPNINWSTVSSTDQTAWRNGAIALAQTFRKVCDKHKLIFIVNGTWNANNGGGYPNASQHGCSLADGGMLEDPDAYNDFWTGYASSSQWGNKVMLAVARRTDKALWSSVCPFTNSQSDYDVPLDPWGPFHATPLPTKVSI